MSRTIKLPYKVPGLFRWLSTCYMERYRVGRKWQ